MSESIIKVNSLDVEFKTDAHGVGGVGAGKSHAAQLHRREHEHTFHILTPITETHFELGIL